MDRSASARPINLRVVLPATWSRRAAQLGGGMNGIIPNLVANVMSDKGPLQRGFATYGSDSGHQSGGPGRGGPGDVDWALNDEAIQNLGSLQMKKTHSY